MPVACQQNLHNITVVLVGTLQAGNIGMAARAMKNMGLCDLRLAAPQCVLDAQAYRKAPHTDDLLDRARSYASLQDAVADCAYVCGTTARDRRRRELHEPRTMAPRWLELARTNRIALVFGREDAGLSNEELEACHDVVVIPTAGLHASLNLSHAVALISYELYVQARQAGSAGAGADTRLAVSADTEPMYAQMRDTLLEIGFLDPQNPDIVLGHLRRLLSRAGMTRREVKVVRGIFRQLGWYLNQTRDYMRRRST